MKYKSKILFILTTILIFISFPLHKVSAKGTLIFDVDVTKISDTDRTYKVNTNTYSLDIYKYNGHVRTRLPLNSTITIDTIINGNVIESQTLTTTSSSTQYAQLGGAGNIGNVTKTKIYIDKGSSEPSEPDKPPNIKDYTTILNNILNAIKVNKIEITYLTNQFTTVKNTITNVSTTITNAITKQTTEIKTSLNTVNSSINTVNNSINTVNTSINTMKNDINKRLDATNSHLNDIKKELQTTMLINKNKVSDISNILEENKAPTPEQKFEDNNKYFEQPNVISNESNMPDMPDIKKWDDVDDPIELSKDIENKTDEELTQDSFTIDNELSQDSFTKDNELSQDTFTKDNELSQDTFTKDYELFQDEFNNTHEYEQTNKFEKQPEFEQTEQDYNLRWKSINGFFK